MKRAVLFLCLAVFILLVIQPNLQGSLQEPTVRVPENTDEPLSNRDIAQRQSASGMTIAIDPGVGEGPAGKSSESEVAMDMAAVLGSTLEKAGYSVVYTRWYDTPDSSQSENDIQSAALEKAREEDADLLISLQYNTGSLSERGFSVFTRPNDETLNLLAENISQELTRSAYSISQGVDTDHYANFPVLAADGMPAVLIQLGYLSNEQEYELLTQPEFQQKLADAITRAVLETMD